MPIFEVLRRHMTMIFAMCIVATVSGYALSFLITERYTASALLLVRPQQAIKIDTHKAEKEFLDFPLSQSMSVETPSKTYIEIIKSRELIGKVVRNLGLDKETEAESSGISKLMPPYVKAAGEDLKQLFMDLIAILKYGRVIGGDPFTKAVKGLEDNLSLKSREDTYLFEITYMGKNAQLAADVANTTAKSFIDFMDEIRLSEAQYVRDHLQAQLEQSRQHLVNARERLQSYKEAHSVFLYESEYTAKLNVISDLQVELAKVEEALVGSQGTLSTVSLAAKRARLISTLREREAELAPLPGIERELKQLELDVQVALAAYEIVEKEFKEADIKHSYPMPEVRLVSQAVPPRLPSSPARATIALVSFLGSLVVSVGLAFFLEYLNRRVRDIHDIEDFVGITVLGTIPRVEPLAPRGSAVKERHVSRLRGGQRPMACRPTITECLAGDLPASEAHDQHEPSDTGR
jgi:uncharacterized protein involved in exopolysaccharide biosynthesis